MSNHEEKEFQKWLRRQWKDWSGSVEYAVGGDAGFADMLLMHKSKKQPGLPLMIPAEIKVALFDNGLLVSQDVRAAQIGWHNAVWSAGGKSIFLFGVRIKRRSNDWAVYVRLGNDVSGWKDGWAIGGNDMVCLNSFDGKSLFATLGDYIEGLV